MVFLQNLWVTPLLDKTLLLNLLVGIIPTLCLFLGGPLLLLAQGQEWWEWDEILRAMPSNRTWCYTRSMFNFMRHVRYLKPYINIKSWHGSYNIATHPSLLKRSWQIPPAWMLVTTKWRNSSGLGASWEWRRGKVDHWPMLINLLGCVVGLCSATMGCW